MIETVSSDGIEIIVEMAKTGKIDPWNVNIVDITDQFLQKLVEMKTSNLRLTGRTLFLAAVLLRLKSDILEGINPFDEDQDDLMEAFDEAYNDLDFINQKNTISIDDVIERRTSVKLNRNRVVTLKDLIKQLEFYEKIEKRKSMQNAKERATRRARSYADFTPEDIVNMAHEEYIEDEVDRLQEILIKLFETNEKIELSELNEIGMDKVSIYITLLFLSARSRIDLVQDEFYSNLYIIQEEELALL